MIVNLPQKGQKGFRSIPIQERIFGKIEITNWCWNWTASVNEDGYGWIKYNGRMKRAHRVIYELRNGPIPKGKYVLHKCDNPACVNPDHLYLGTQFENMRDMFSRGRGNPGGYKNKGPGDFTRKIEDILDDHEG